MKCTMLKLFQSLLGTTLCGGQTCTLGGLNTSARVYLSQHNCLRKDTDYTNAELIMNRLIPDRIEIDKISDVDICDNHKRNLTVLHKSTRQKHCAFSECKKLGRINKPGVDFELSALLYERTGLHIPVGSVLCYEHRNLVTSGALAEQQIFPPVNVLPVRHHHLEDGVSMDDQDAGSPHNKVFVRETGGAIFLCQQNKFIMLILDRMVCSRYPRWRSQE